MAGAVREFDRAFFFNIWIHILSHFCCIYSSLLLVLLWLLLLVLLLCIFTWWYCYCCCVLVSGDGYLYQRIRNDQSKTCFFIFICCTNKNTTPEPATHCVCVCKMVMKANVMGRAIHMCVVMCLRLCVALSTRISLISLAWVVCNFESLKLWYTQQSTLFTWTS